MDERVNASARDVSKAVARNRFTTRVPAGTPPANWVLMLTLRMRVSPSSVMSWLTSPCSHAAAATTAATGIHRNNRSARFRRMVRVSLTVSG
ncbi:MAG: hypothetical protein A3I79_08295 [Gemmatimonadetes bacterium RIFCSPLOWO2_02_FULL_71_11]|nr:MAG: hypothetical protein A3I79_08295 [Gemmatimonadetes bacterium RIFCSPLOWO2_02_FULL_71_11]